MEKNDSNTYDIYYQKFDHEGNKVGETLIVSYFQSAKILSNLTTNEFTLNNSGPPGAMDISVHTPSLPSYDGSKNFVLRDKNVKKDLKFLQLDDDSYVTAWVETQDQTDLGLGYQRFDSDGNALAPKFIEFETTRPESNSEITLEKGQGLNDFSIGLSVAGPHGTEESFKVSSYGEKNKLYKTESDSYILDYAGHKVNDAPDDQ